VLAGSEPTFTPGLFTPNSFYPVSGKFCRFTLIPNALQALTAPDQHPLRLGMTCCGSRGAAGDREPFEMKVFESPAFAREVLAPTCSLPGRRVTG
jgi:hypothetical protein